MFASTAAFSSFSVNDLAAAKRFYGETLGLGVEESAMGTLDITLAGGSRLFVYPKPDHQPATFTVLNFDVDDIDRAVDDLNARGVKTKIYADGEIPDMPQNDEKGITRDDENGMAIAWFTDPAGNVLAVMQTTG